MAGCSCCLKKCNLFNGPGCVTTIELLLRRSVQGSVRHWAIASQFTQSAAKGRTLVRSVIYSTFVKSETSNVKTCSSFLSRLTSHDSIVRSLTDNLQPSRPLLVNDSFAFQFLRVNFHILYSLSSPCIHNMHHSIL